MPKVTPEVEAAIFTLADEGKSQRAIAAALNLSQPTVGERLKARKDRASYVAAAPPAAPAAPAPTADLVAELRELATDFDSMAAPAQADTCRRAADALAVVTAQPEEEDAPLDALAVIRRVIRAHERDHDTWLAVGNSAQANRAGRTVGLLLPVLARLEKESRHQDGMIHVSKAEIDAAMVALRERKRALCDRPLLCKACGRALSVQWAEVDPPTEEAANA